MVEKQFQFILYNFQMDKKNNTKFRCYVYYLFDEAFLTERTSTGITNISIEISFNLVAMFISVPNIE